MSATMGVAVGISIDQLPGSTAPPAMSRWLPTVSTDGVCVCVCVSARAHLKGMGASLLLPCLSRPEAMRRKAAGYW